jgi:hypothetical protein
VDKPLTTCLPGCLPPRPPAPPCRPPPLQVQAFDGPGNGDPMLITSSTPGNDAAGTTASASATASANATGPAAEKGAAKGGTSSSAGKAPTAEKGSAPASSSGSGSASGCSDVPTPDGNSCKQQKGERERGGAPALRGALHCLEGCMT